MSEALHNKYRPKTLRRIIGHETAVAALTKAIDSGKVPSYLLLLGPTSVGKSTLAYAVARAVLQTDSLKGNPNFSEYNLSEDRGIDGVRGIIRESRLSPRGADRRIILLEESQGILSNAPAANAFLSALEHPPATTTFIMCSMEASKFSASTLGKALKNRASMQFNLQAPGTKELTLQARRICKGEGIDWLDEKQIRTIVNGCGGEMRTLASALETLINVYAANETISDDDIQQVVQATAGGTDDAAVEKFIVGCLSGNMRVAQRAILDITDATGVAMKICSAVTFVLNSLVLGGEKHPKVWGTPAGYSVLKQIGKTSADMASVAELNARLVDFRLQAGAFAVPEQLALSALAWKFINRNA